MLRFSHDNLVEAATLTGSTQDATYVAANAASPQRPFLPWRTTATTAQSLVVNFGAAKALTVVGLVRTNYVTVNIQGNAADAWGAPTYDQAITVARNPWNTRHQHVHLPVAFNFQFLRILIAAQTPTDAAAYFLTGGVWAATDLTSAPRNPTYSLQIRRVEPVIEVQPRHRGWRQRASAGYPITTIRARRQASITLASAGSADELNTWLNLDRLMHDADYNLVYLDQGDASQGWVMRRVSEPEFTLDGPTLTEGDVEYEEVVGP
jgi:hypothetical protein